MLSLEQLICGRLLRVHLHGTMVAIIAAIRIRRVSPNCPDSCTFTQGCLLILVYVNIVDWHIVYLFEIIRYSHGIIKRKFALKNQIIVYQVCPHCIGIFV